ncbi:hypothetical protein M9H77_35360 [Catharanthus roseus]|uniref:Uncharacterized protein n=1 Tax=Catharanthus roseus TaxID=4058 RepID=A0ACB9ZP21_CATRO|nr:hypothetical protein M9H77_35360 [Catharanthus roseus]
MGMSLANQNLPMTFPQLSRTDLKSSNIRMCEGEIRTSLFQMVPFKIPRPDGLPPAIFQYFNSKKWKELGAGNSVRSLHSKVDLHKNGYGNHSFLCNEDHEATNWGYYRVGTALAKTFSGFWATSKVLDSQSPSASISSDVNRKSQSPMELKLGQIITSSCSLIQLILGLLDCVVGFRGLSFLKVLPINLGKVFHWHVEATKSSIDVLHEGGKDTFAKKEVGLKASSFLKEYDKNSVANSLHEIFHKDSRFDSLMAEDSIASSVGHVMVQKTQLLLHIEAQLAYLTKLVEDIAKFSQEHEYSIAKSRIAWKRIVRQVMLFLK